MSEKSGSCLPRFRFAFRLRTVLVLVALVAAWLASQVRWVHERRELLAAQQAIAAEADKSTAEYERKHPHRHGAVLDDLFDNGLSKSRFLPNGSVKLSSWQ